MGNPSTPRTFGITTNLSGVSTGIIANGLSFNKSVETAEARNEKGEIIDIAAYSKQKTLSINGLHVGTGIEPGDIITVGTEQYLVQSNNKSENNTTFQESSIECRTADNATLHALSSIIG